MRNQRKVGFNMANSIKLDWRCQDIKFIPGTDVELVVEDKTERVKLSNGTFEELFDQYRESIGEKTISELEDRILDMELRIENLNEIIEAKERYEDITREKFFDPSYQKGVIMSEGWVKLHRCLFNKAIWQNSTPEQKVILITLLGMANHSGREWEWKGKQFKAEPGMLVTSLDSICTRCGKGISVQNVRSALNKFEKYEFLTQEVTKTGRLINIVNWGVYQGGNVEGNKETNKEVTKSQQSTNKEVTKSQQRGNN